MQGRNLVIKIKKNRKRCRYLKKKAITIEMGPVLAQNLRTAPEYYAT